MSLDACVYCDCLEKGRLKNLLPPATLVKVEVNGFPSLERNGVTVWDDVECEHKFGCLVHHPIRLETSH